MKRKTVKDLRKAVESRLKSRDQTVIEIEGLQFNVDYAKYLLHYLTMRKIHEDTPLRDILISKQK